MSRFAWIQLEPFPLPAAFAIAGAVKDSSHKYFCLVSINPERIINFILKHNIDLAGFYCTFTTLPALEIIAREIKRRTSCKVIFGGPHPTISPQFFHNSNADMICRGEGVEAIIEVLDALKGLREISFIKNLWVKKESQIAKNSLRPLIYPLDRMPEFDFTIYNKHAFLRNNDKIGIINGIGCPFSCYYCSNSAIQDLYKNNKPYFRLFSVKRVVSDIRKMLQTFPKATNAYFQVENLGDDISYINDLFNAYSTHFDIPFSLSLRLEKINNDIVKAIASTDLCIAVHAGIESGSYKLRKRVLNRYVMNSALIRGSRLLHKEGLKLCTTNMFGIPGETPEEMWSTISLNTRMKTDFTVASFFTPIPGTSSMKDWKTSGNVKTNALYENTPFFPSKAICSDYQTLATQLKSLMPLLVCVPGLQRMLKPVLPLKFDLPFRIASLLLYTIVDFRRFDFKLKNGLQHFVLLRKFQRNIRRLMQHA